MCLTISFIEKKLVYAIKTLILKMLGAQITACFDTVLHIRFPNDLKTV